MSDQSFSVKKTAHTYQRRAKRYNSTVQFFNFLSSFGFDIPAWRLKAVQALELKPGDTVVDLGCGTGLNFPIIQEAIGPSGKIIGVDLSHAMLEKAQSLTFESGWQNVELVCSDAAQYDFPHNIDGIVSTFALVLVPECGRAVANGCQALCSGGRFSVLDMCWPEGWSFGWRHAFFWLRFYGVTGETLERRPWKAIWETMDANLINITRNRFWYGMMYRIWGVRN